MSGASASAASSSQPQQVKEPEVPVPGSPVPGIGAAAGPRVAEPKKKARSFKIPFFGGGGRKAPTPDPVPPEGAFRRRTSSVGPDEEMTVQKKKSGNLGKYRRDIDPEPRSTPNF